MRPSIAGSGSGSRGSAVPERYRVRWTRTAEEDLTAILEYVAREESVGRAVSLYTTLRAAIDGLVAFPRRARVIPELRAFGLRDFREILVGPYRVGFRLDGRLIVLLAVLDGRRDLEELLLERALRELS